jgi:hypothetical protein
MTAIMQIDTLGKRYGLLPSEVLKRSDTFDLYIMDAALSFEQYHHKKAMNNGKEPIQDYITQEQLVQIAQRADEQYGKLKDNSK